MEYIVITSVSDSKNGGNLAVALGSAHQKVAEGDESNGWLGEFDQLHPMIALGLYVPVFHPGEILVCSDGREVAGKGRKPSKWDVQTETFDNIEAATERAIAITNGGN